MVVVGRARMGHGSMSVRLHRKTLNGQIHGSVMDQKVTSGSLLTSVSCPSQSPSRRWGSSLYPSVDQDRICKFEILI